MVCTDPPATASAGSPAIAIPGIDGPAGSDHRTTGERPGPIASSSERPEPGSRLRALRFALWGAALLLGALDAWCWRFSMYPDGVSYIDIASAYARGDWHHALNAYWSPLYSWLLALALRLLHPGAAAEFPAAHLVNFLIFAAALAAFDFFWRAWLEDHLARTADCSRAGWTTLPPEALLAIGYALFTWSSISLIGVQLVTPDLLMTALVYLAAGLTLRLRRGGHGPRTAALLGAVLGLGFLAKAVMLPLAPVFLLVALLPRGADMSGRERTRNRERAKPRKRQTTKTRRPRRSGEEQDENGARPRGGPLSNYPFVAFVSASCSSCSFGVSRFRSFAVSRSLRIFPRCRWLPARRLHRASLCLLAATFAFLVVIAPFVGALSLKEGRFAVGDTGRLNYAWFVNGVPMLNWQGEIPGAGKPTHPTRLLYPAPPVYEFAGPIRGSYPVWTDPSYWDEGVRTRFDWRQQVRTLLKNLKIYREFLWTDQSGLMAGVLMLLLTTALVARRRLLSLVSWELLLLSAVPIVLYGLVVVECRYLGAFVVLFWLALLPEVKLPANETSRAMMVSATMAILLTPLLGLARTSARDFLQKRMGRSAWETATGLRALGLRAGDRVGCIGRLAFDIGWPRLARVSVVAEIPTDREAEYWSASPPVRAAALSAFAGAGARAVLTAHPPAAGAASGWHRLGATLWYVHMLNAHTQSSVPE